MLSFNEFTKYMQHLGLLQDQMERISSILRDPLYDDIQNDFVSPYAVSNPRIEQDVIDLLEIIMEDDDHWISYFIFELDFGRNNNKYSITDADGNNISLASISDLWTLLQK